jgi:4-amino-4-deoxy-L-arabinose transferase-like glycosyltransferase
LGSVIALGTAMTERWLPPLLAARSGTMLLFALAVGAVFYRLWREYTLSVALTAVGALLIMPRLFAHAHFALFDSLVTSCWLLSWALFAPALCDWRWSLPWGVALGATLSAKFTGWLAPLPFVLWALIYRDRRAGRALAIGLPLALVTFWALNPPLWHAPLSGWQTFWHLNTHRAERPELNITTWFFGSMYDLDYPLPWYNTLAWTVMTVLPLPLLIGAAGVYQSLRHWRSDPAAVLLVLQWATLMVVRATPWAPPHDAERLILPSFAFFALLTGVGAGRLLYRESLLAADKICAQRWAIVLLGFCAVNGISELYRYEPQWLSYYSRVVGGLPGAVALGMEPTYYWDALDAPVWRWLDEHTAPDEKIAFGAGPRRNLAWLQCWGVVKHGFRPADPGSFRWYVRQRRPSAWQAWDYWLLEHAEPAYQRKLQGQPLIDVYAYDDYVAARKATADAQAN